MFCQACGAKNSEDARFCNMCGAAIAALGAPGGPVHEPTQLGVGDVPTPRPADGQAEPPTTVRVEPGAPVQGGGGSMADVSLADMGVRSNGQAVAVLVGVVVLLMALGGVVTWLGMGSDAPPPAETGRADPGDPFVIGAPVPEGDFARGSEPPPADDRQAAVPPPTTRRRTREHRRRARPSSETAPSSPAPASASATQAPSTPATTATTGSEASAEPEAPPASSSAAPSAAGSSPEGDASGGPEEGATEMDMYAARVRFLVRRYYATRAQSCFDHATRNDPELHGQVVVAMTIAASGEVSRATVSRNSTGDDALGQCLANQVGTWRLSPPPSGSVDMQMPFSR